MAVLNILHTLIHTYNMKRRWVFSKWSPGRSSSIFNPSIWTLTHHEILKLWRNFDARWKEFCTLYTRWKQWLDSVLQNLRKVHKSLLSIWNTEMQSLCALRNLCVFPLTQFTHIILRAKTITQFARHEPNRRRTERLTPTKYSQNKI